VRADPEYHSRRTFRSPNSVVRMHIDRRIAILGLLGTAALAVAMMAAPLLFADLPRWLLEILFWGGLLLATTLIGTSIVVAFLGEASEPPIGHRRRMIALLGMIISGISFLTFAAIYFWPERPTPTVASLAAATTPSSPQKPWKHELEDLYVSDFNLLSTQREWEAKALDTPDDPAQNIIKIKFRIYQDFNSGTDFVSIYIPISHNIKIEARIYGIIVFSRDQIKPQYDDLKNSVGTGMSGPGVPYSEGKDLKFSGRVLIYTMQPFTPVQIGDLMKWYQDAGLSLQIRGYDYWWANKDR
jgi:hypothetical protein